MSIKRTLITYTNQPGGELEAMNCIVRELKSNSSMNIAVKKLKFITPTLNIKHRPFQLLRNLISHFYESVKILNNLTTTPSFKTTIIYSTSLPFIFISLLYPSTRKCKKIYHHFSEKHKSIAQEVKEEKSIVRKYIYILPFYILLSLIEIIAIKYIDKIIAPSKYSKRYIEKKYSTDGNKVKIAYNAYDRDTFYFIKKKKRTEKSINLLFVGRLDPIKGIRELIKSMDYIDKDKLAKLTILYPNPTDKIFSKEVYLLARSQKNNRIDFICSPSKQEIANNYRNHDISVLPSYQENFPVSFLESLACGTPMLTTPLGDVEEIQKEIWPKLIIQKPQPEHIAKAIEDFYHLSNKTKEEIQRRCLRVAKRYSWKKSASEIAELIEDIVEKK